ncbi:MAG: hypothetical protein EXR01_07400 [Acetobacteraceae bacterium]|nr:hypothetical protein [Acetobacteraceae bacterium]
MLREPILKGQGHLTTIAKCQATDAATKIAIDAVQLFGAAGIFGDFPINRYSRDTKVL